VAEQLSHQDYVQVFLVHVDCYVLCLKFRPVSLKSSTVSCYNITKLTQYSLSYTRLAQLTNN